MSKEEIEKLKEEIRGEVREEMRQALESAKKHSFWHVYVKEYIEPTIQEKVGNSKIKWAIQSGINAFARAITKRDHVNKITEEELESLKPRIETILNQI